MMKTWETVVGVVLLALSMATMAGMLINHPKMWLFIDLGVIVFNLAGGVMLLRRTIP